MELIKYGMEFYEVRGVKIVNSSAWMESNSGSFIGDTVRDVGGVEVVLEIFNPAICDLEVLNKMIDELVEVHGFQADWQFKAFDFTIITLVKSGELNNHCHESKKEKSNNAGDISTRKVVE